MMKKETKTMIMEIPAALHSKIEEKARKTGIYMTAIAKLAIQEYFDRNDRN